MTGRKCSSIFQITCFFNFLRELNRLTWAAQHGETFPCTLMTTKYKAVWIHITVVFNSVQREKGFTFHQGTHQIRPWWGSGGFGTWVKAVLKYPSRCSANLAFDFNNYTSTLRKTDWTFKKKTYLVEETGKSSCNMVANFHFLYKSGARSNTLCKEPVSGNNPSILDQEKRIGVLT